MFENFGKKLAEIGIMCHFLPKSSIFVEKSLKIRRNRQISVENRFFFEFLYHKDALNCVC